MHAITVVCRNVMHRRGRTAVTVAGLVVAVAAVVSLVGLADRFEQSFFELYQRRGADLVVQRAGNAVQLSSGIDASLGGRIEKLPHVREVIGCLMDMIAFEQEDLFAVLVNGWDAKSPVWDRVERVAGRRPKSGEHNTVMLGQAIARSLNKKVGDQVEIYAEPFQVVGVFSSFSVFENGAVFMLLPELQRLMDRPHHVTGYVIQVDKSGGAGRVEEVRRQIEGLEPGLAVVPTGEFVRNIAQIRVIRVMAWVTSWVALVIGAVGVSNTMAMSLFERQVEVGTLRAIGWTTARVIRMILSESLLMCLAGAIGGSLLGASMIWLLARLPMTSVLVDGQIAASTFGVGFALALAAGLLGAVYPAWWVARLTPLVALRRK